MLIKQGGANSNLIRFASGILDIRTGTATISGSQITQHQSFSWVLQVNSLVANGNIEISSSRFHLTKEGNITASNVNLSGKITAQTGTIGGFNIGDDLDSTSDTKT